MDLFSAQVLFFWIDRCASKQLEAHLLEHSPFSGRKRIGLGDRRQIFA
jgi:hypothetical protein